MNQPVLPPPESAFMVDVDELGAKLQSLTDELASDVISLQESGEYSRCSDRRIRSISVYLLGINFVFTVAFTLAGFAATALSLVACGIALWMVPMALRSRRSLIVTSEHMRSLRGRMHVHVRHLNELFKARRFWTHRLRETRNQERKLRQSIALMTTQSDSLQDDAAALLHRLGELRHQCEDAEQMNRMNAVTIEAGNTAILDLETQRDRIAEEIAFKTSQLGDLTDQVALSAASLLSLDDDIGRKLQQQHDIDAETQLRSRDLEAIKQETIDTESTLASALSALHQFDNASSIQQQLIQEQAARRESIERSIRQIVELDEYERSLRDDITLLATELDQFRSQRSTLGEEAKSSENALSVLRVGQTTLDREMAELVRQIDAQAIFRDQLEKAVDTLQAERDIVQESMETLQSTETELQLAVTNLTSDHAVLKGQVRSLADMVTTNELTINQQTPQMESLREECEMLTALITQSTAAQSQCRDQLDAIEITVGEKREELDAIQVMIDDAQSQWSQSQALQRDELASFDRAVAEKRSMLDEVQGLILDTESHWSNSQTARRDEELAADITIAEKRSQLDALNAAFNDANLAWEDTNERIDLAKSQLAKMQELAEKTSSLMQEHENATRHLQKQQSTLATVVLETETASDRLAVLKKSCEEIELNIKDREQTMASRESEWQELIAQYDGIKAQILEAQAVAAQWSEYLEKLSGEVESKTSKKAELEAQIDLLGDQSTAAIESLQAAKDAIGQLAVNRENLTLECASERVTLQTLKTELAEIRHDRDQAFSAKETATERLRQTTQQCTIQQDLLQQLEVALASKKASIEGLNEHCETLEAQAVDLRRQMDNENRLIVSHKELGVGLMQQIREAETALSSREQTRDLLCQEIEKLQEAVVALSTDHKSLIDQRNELTECANKLRRTIDQSQADIRSANEQRKQLDDECSSVVDDMTAARNRSQDELNSINLLIEQKTDALHGLRLDTEAALSSRDQTRDLLCQEIDKLQEAVDSLSTERKSLIEQRDELTDYATELRRAIDQTREDIRSATEQKKQLNDDCLSSVDDMTAARNRSQDELNSISALIEQKTDALRGLRLQVDAAIAARDAAERELQATAKKSGQVAEEIERKDELLCGMNDVIAKRQAECDEFSERLQSANQSLSSLIAKQNQYETEIVALCESERESREAIRQIMEEEAIAKNNLEATRAEIDRLQHQQSSESLELAVLRDALASVAQEIELGKQTYRNLEAEIDEGDKSVTDMATRVRELNADVAALEAAKRSLDGFVAIADAEPSESKTEPVVEQAVLDSVAELMGDVRGGLKKDNVQEPKLVLKTKSKSKDDWDFVLS